MKQSVAPGQIVEIPLLNRRERGLIFRLLSTKPDFETLEIGRIRTLALLAEKQLIFLQQISEYNFCSMSKTLALFLPENIWKSGGMPPRESFLQLISPSNSTKLRGVKQQLLQELLESHDGEMLETAIKNSGVTTNVIENLIGKKIVRRIAKDYPSSAFPKNSSAFPRLTTEQQKVFAKLAGAKKTVLIGPAGSGKTLLALKLIAETISDESCALVLIPERYFGLEMKSLFSQYFPADTFELYHSFLSEGEKTAIWWKIREKRTRIVFGTRAALFLPFQNLRLVIVEEEHDTSYKNEQTPRYHARQAAEMLAETHSARLILQSATPSFESFFRAGNGELTLLRLSERFGQSGISPFHLVDLRLELAAKNFSPFSNLLQEKIHGALRKKRQVLLFLNRRGKYSALVCRQCGAAILCRHCHNRTTLHEDRHKREFLLCHHCGHIDPVPLSCPRCNSNMLKGFGIGTQEIEREAKKLFPEARVLRADRDSSGRKQDIFEAFSSGMADILIGTEIITKGTDFPNISLTGILLADTELHLPDFRASEYAFQLFNQVAGTGQKNAAGEVVLQTYLPEHPAVEHSRHYDFEGFYEHEMAERKAMSLPPYTHMIRLIFADAIQKKALQQAQKWQKILQEKWRRDFSKEHFLISLAPALQLRQFHKFHYHLFLSGKNPEKLLENESLPGIRVDRDPVESF